MGTPAYPSASWLALLGVLLFWNQRHSYNLHCRSVAHRIINNSFLCIILGSFMPRVSVSGLTCFDLACLVWLVPVAG
jgi:hypothetical protein